MNKQETIEEAADNYSKELTQVVAFYQGAKWQQKRSYSEEEMIAFALFLEIHLPMKPRKTHHQLLEQFKKEIR